MDCEDYVIKSIESRVCVIKSMDSDVYVIKSRFWICKNGFWGIGLIKSMGCWACDISMHHCMGERCSAHILKVHFGSAKFQ